MSEVKYTEEEIEKIKDRILGKPGGKAGQNEKSYADIPYQEDRKPAPCTPCTGGSISGIFFSYRITDGAEGIK